MNADKDNAGKEGGFSLGQGSDYFQSKRKHRAANIRSGNYTSSPLQSPLTAQVPQLWSQGAVQVDVAVFLQSSVKYALLKQWLWM